MKYLQDYQEQQQTELFNKLGVFFAFSWDQFKEQAKEENKPYSKLPGGMVCPSSNVDELIKQLDTIYAAALAQDLEENGKDKIIIRELYNHECFYLGDWSNAIGALKPYKFTEEEIKAAFYKEYPEAAKYL